MTQPLSITHPESICISTIIDHLPSADDLHSINPQPYVVRPRLVLHSHLYSYEPIQLGACEYVSTTMTQDIEHQVRERDAKHLAWPPGAELSACIQVFGLA